MTSFIIFNRLAGVSPFAAETLEEIYENNKKGLIEFPEELWKEVSKEAKELAQLMTHNDQYKRFSIQECLSHPWFFLSNKQTNPLLSARQNLQKNSSRE